MIFYGTAFTKEGADILRDNGMGFEIAQYANPIGLDSFDTLHPTITQYMQGMRGYSMHGPYYDLSYTSIDTLVLDLTKKRFIQCIEAAKFHEVKHMIFHSAFRQFDRAPSRREAFLNKTVDFWKSFEENIPGEMTVYLENVEDEDPGLFIELIKGIDSPKIRCCFDIGHAYVNSPVELSAWIRTLGSAIGHVHIHDNDGKDDLHLPLGEGDIPLLNAIYDIQQYAGESVPLALECDSHKSMKWMKANKLI